MVEEKEGQKENVKAEEVEKAKEPDVVKKPGKLDIGGGAPIRRNGEPESMPSSFGSPHRILGADEEAHRKAFLECLKTLRCIYKVRVIFALITFCGACLLAAAAAIVAFTDTCTESWSPWSQCSGPSGNATRHRCDKVEQVPCECPAECSDLLPATTVSELRRISCNNTKNGVHDAYFINSQAIVEVDNSKWIASPACS